MLSYIIHLFPTLFFSFLTIFLFIDFTSYNYTSSNISPSLLLFYLSITVYLSVTILQSLHLLFILTFLLPILFTIKIFPTQKVNTLSLSLSLSLYIYIYIYIYSFCLIFNSLLHLYLKLINFCVEFYFGLMQFGCVLICCFLFFYFL